MTTLSHNGGSRHLSIEYNYMTVRKFSHWAGRLPETIDFIDYWYHFFLSKTKEKIESDPMHHINAFHWTRWQEDFEDFVDRYTPRPGEAYSEEERSWFAAYMQYLVYAMQLLSRNIAEHYGKDVFTNVMGNWFQYHCFGVDQFITRFVEKYGLPTEVTEVKELRM